MIGILKKLLSETLGKSRQSGKFNLRETDFGLVTVEIGVVQRLAERAAASVRGVRDAILFVEPGDKFSPFKIRVTVTMEQGYSAPKISESVDEKINDVLNFSLQTARVPVEVRISEVTRTAIEKRKRVR